MDSFKLTIGKNIEGDIPMSYKNIIAIMIEACRSNFITRNQLEEFLEKCDNFFEASKIEDLYQSDLLYKIFTE